VLPVLPVPPVLAVSPWLRRRDPDAHEQMDDPRADPVTLARTFARFAPVNAVVSGRGAVYRRWIRPRLRARARGAAPLRVLDVGTGGGDLPRALLRLAARDGLALAVLAIDPDPRAIAAARARPPMAGLELAQTTTGALAEAG
jgi:2-polyprenyl-3-methyl-5-hydroxy-6-metoxy-1,4-benzoquinol methylase